MKSNTVNYWCASLVGMTILSFATTAFASTKDCKNPVEVPLKSTVKMRFCEIPAGTAILGSNANTVDLQPVKKTFKRFQMGQYAVTQSQYKILLNEEPWKKNGKARIYAQEGDHNPANYISYEQANAFAKQMNLIDRSATYRLPTEAEWEYAARGGMQTEYYWGNEFLQSFAYSRESNMQNEEYAHNVLKCPDAVRDAKEPGYCANRYGLMHMLGNLAQWVLDAYIPTWKLNDMNATKPSTNGHAAVPPSAGPLRVVRGSSWIGFASHLRVVERNSGAPHEEEFTKGFRLVRISK